MATKGGWVLDLGTGCALATKKAVTQKITAHGGTVALSPTSRPPPSFYLVSDDLYQTTQTLESADDCPLKLRNAFTAGLAVVPLAYLDACIAADAQLDPWPFQLIGTRLAPTYGATGLDDLVTKAFDHAVVEVVTAASVAYYDDVLRAVQHGVDTLRRLCGGVLPASHFVRSTHPTTVRTLPSLVTAFYSFDSSAAAAVVAVNNATRSATMKPTTTTAMKMTTKETLQKNKEERERMRQEQMEQRRLERAAEKENGSMAQAKRDRDEAMKQRTAEKLAIAVERQRQMAIHKAERDKAMQEAMNRAKAMRERARQSLIEARERAGSLFNLGKDLADASDLAQQEVEEAHRQRQLAKQKAMERKMREARRLKAMKRDAKERAKEQAKIEKLQAKAVRREQWTEEKRLADIAAAEAKERRREAFLVRKARREARDAERAAKGLRHIEHLEPVDERKLFVGGIKMDDIDSKVEDVNKRAMLKQRRSAVMCEMFNEFGTVTQWDLHMDKGFAHVVYRVSKAVERCVSYFKVFEERKKSCEETVAKLKKGPPALTAELAAIAAPLPGFYVRKPRTDGPRTPEELQKLKEKHDKKQQEQKQKKSMSSVGGRGRGRGGARGGRGRGASSSSSSAPVVVGGLFDAPSTSNNTRGGGRGGRGSGRGGFRGNRGGGRGASSSAAPAVCGTVQTGVYD